MRSRRELLSKLRSRKERAERASGRASWKNEPMLVGLAPDWSERASSANCLRSPHQQYMFSVGPIYCIYCCQRNDKIELNVTNLSVNLQISHFCCYKWGDLELGQSQALFQPPSFFWSPQFPLGPPTMVAVVVNFYDRAYWVLISKLADP